MKIKVKLANPTLKLKHHNSASSDRILHDSKVKKQNQLSKAVKYCLENNCKGYKAIESGLFPLIKDPRTINRRLPIEMQSKKAKPAIEEGEEKSYCTILTKDEETTLVAYFKNRNRFVWATDDEICSEQYLF